MKFPVAGPKISTLVCNGSIPCSFDLPIIFEYLPLCDSVLGIRYKDQSRGSGFRSSRSFYNEATIIVHIPGKVVNVKTFCNGRFQVSGIKSVAQATEAIQFLLTRFMKIQGNKEVPTVFRDGMILSPSGTIIYNSNLEPIGSISYSLHAPLAWESASIVLHGEKVERIGNEFVSVAFVARRKSIYALNGILIGHLVFIPQNPNRKNVCLKHATIIPHEDQPGDFVCYSKWNQYCIGRISRVLLEIPPYEIPPVTTTHRKYSAILHPEAVIDPTELKVWTSNINFTASIPLDTTCRQTIDRSKLMECLSAYALKCQGGARAYYEPSFYPGVKFSSYLSWCGNYHSKSKKCKECIRMTLILFKSGKVIVSGCRTLAHMDSAMSVLKNVVEAYSSIFIKNGVLPDSHFLHSRPLLSILDVL